MKWSQHTLIYHYNFYKRVDAECSNVQIMREKMRQKVFEDVMIERIKGLKDQVMGMKTQFKEFFGDSDIV